MTTLKPFFHFYGGKYRASKYYPQPRHQTIIEPFAGSAGYSVTHHTKNVVLIDANDKICATWDYLIGVSPEEILSLPEINHSQSVNDLNIAQEAKLLVGWWLNSAVSSPRKTPSAWMRRGTHQNSFWGLNIKQRIAKQVGFIRHWKIIHEDYAYAPDIDATWFVDPPYEKMGKHYRLHDIDYQSLAAWCKSRTGQVIVCENVVANWLPFRPWRDIRGTSTKRGAKVSHEAIWEYDTNVVVPAAEDLKQ